MSPCRDHATPADRLAQCSRLAIALRDLAAIIKPRPVIEPEVPMFLRKQAD
ncbi:MAG: hypothetical protein ACK52V_04665 [Betaproteobacteria bacterium]